MKVLRLIIVIGSALMATAVVAALVLALAGHDPLTAAGVAGKGVFGSWRSLARNLEDVAPLLLCGLATGVAFRAGVLNIGGEGQFLVGAAVTIALCTTFRPPGPAWLVVILALTAASGIGALWALLAGGLERWRGVNLVLSTILLNFLAVFLVSWLAESVLRDPLTTAPQTAAMARDLRLPVLVPKTYFHIGIPIAVLIASVIWILQRQTRLGFEWRMCGANPDAAQALGIPVVARRLQVGALSGALAGLAGGVQTAGVTYALSGSTHSFGYLGVAVALLGGLHPIGIVIAAIFFSLLDGGSRSLEFGIGVPRNLADLLKGVALLSILIGSAWLARRARQRVVVDA